MTDQFGREINYARILHGGKISVGDELELATEKIPLDAAIITVSDRGFHGLRDENTSGDRCEDLLTAAGYKIFQRTILPDVKKLLVDKLIELADAGVGLIVTTGGTGFSVRDIMPEATLEVCTRLAPGIPEAMRNFSMQVTRRAMLSQAIAGIRKRSLIVNLLGSPKAVVECLNFVLPELRHGIEILRGEADKRFVEVGGVNLLENILRKAQVQNFAEIFLCVEEELSALKILAQRYGAKLLVDEIFDAGPLSGLANGLARHAVFRFRGNSSIDEKICGNSSGHSESRRLSTNVGSILSARTCGNFFGGIGSRSAAPKLKSRRRAAVRSCWQIESALSKGRGRGIWNVTCACAYR